jgi:hypothetical protein
MWLLQGQRQLELGHEGDAPMPTRAPVARKQQPENVAKHSASSLGHTLLLFGHRVSPWPRRRPTRTELPACMLPRAAVTWL